MKPDVVHERTSLQPTAGALQTKVSGRQSLAGLRYRPIVTLGQGGMADVLLSVGKGPGGFNKLVVLKAIRAELVGDSEMRQLFLAEARLSAQLNNANVVQVYEVIDAARPCIVMEYLDGQPLSRLLTEAGDQFTLPLQLKVISDVLAGLHYSHELKDLDGTPLNIVHRDVSPQNVFVTYDGVVKILDFGIAQTSISMGHTRTGVIKGKIAYMPREQLLNDALDRRADIYAVGCMLWQAASGVRLWSWATEGDVMRALIDGTIPRPSEYREVDPKLEQIVMKALAANPDDRFPTALALRESLDDYLTTSGAQVTTRDVGDLVCAIFAEQREERQREIQAAHRTRSSIPPSSATEGLESIIQSSPADAKSRTNKSRWVWGTIIALTVIALVVTAALVSRRPSHGEIAQGANTMGNQGANLVEHGHRVCTVNGNQPPTPCGHETLVDDMEDGDGKICELQGRAGQWEAYSDGTGKQSPSSGAIRSMQDLPECRGFSSRALRVQGVGFTSWGMGVDLNLANHAPFDYKKLIGLRFWAKSNTDTLTHVRVEVATPETLDASFGGACVPGSKACNDHYGVNMVVSGSWVLYDVTFDSLKQEGWGIAAPWSPGKAIQIHWVFKDPDFDVWIDDVALR